MLRAQERLAEVAQRLDAQIKTRETGQSPSQRVDLSKKAPQRPDPWTSHAKTRLSQSGTTTRVEGRKSHDRAAALELSSETTKEGLPRADPDPEPDQRFVAEPTPKTGDRRRGLPTTATGNVRSAEASFVGLDERAGDCRFLGPGTPGGGVPGHRGDCTERRGGGPHMDHCSVASRGGCQRERQLRVDRSAARVEHWPAYSSSQRRTGRSCFHACGLADMCTTTARQARPEDSPEHPYRGDCSQCDLGSETPWLVSAVPAIRLIDV